VSNVHVGKVVVVTGAARGIGQAVAVCFAERGARVVGIDRLDCDETESLVRKTGGEWLGLKADLTSEEEVQRCHRAVKERFAGADILVNVAAIQPSMDWDETDYATWKKVQTINLDSQFLACKAFVPDMRARGWGRIINFASGIVAVATPRFVAYRTSKAAIIGFTRGLATDLGGDNITVNAVSPSFVVTPGTTEAGNAGLEPSITQAQVIKRPATRHDILGLVSFLASDDAAFVTGQMMHADGGLVFR
jgi:NAD(P)-dependent dehydrogenase (short-subunit alcohol dehydrogenase family)